MDHLAAMLEAGAKRRAERRANGEKTVVLSPIEKARKNPTSLRAAINGKCWDCVGAGNDPNPRRDIRECTITDCTLWPVRPYQTKAEAEEGDEDEDTTPLEIES